MKNKVAIFVLTILCVTLFVPTAFAAEVDDNNIITFEEYEKVIQDEFAKYNLEFKFTQTPDEDLVITQTMLDMELARISEMMKNNVPYVTESSILRSDSVENYSSSENGIEPYAMIVEKTYKQPISVYADDGFTAADIVVQVKTTIDADRIVGVEILSCESYHEGLSFFFKGWDQQSARAWFDNPNEEVYASVDGRLSTGIETGIGVGATVTCERTLECIFDMYSGRCIDWNVIKR